jgi:hypothetical protein
MIKDIPQPARPLSEDEVWGGKPESTVDVDFRVHGLVCHQCEQILMSDSVEMLAPFANAHKDHARFGAICEIVSPERMTGGPMMEISFSPVQIH